jgi:hypothetical protein
MTSIPPPSWRAQMRASPELYPLDLDPVGDGVTVLKLARVDYERASFLDARLERPPAMSPSFAELTAAAEGLPVACDFIFHVGHVGSTLMSRLLGFHPRVFSLREPQALRTFARVAAAGGPWSPAEAAERLQTFLALYSRVWTPAQRSLIKATSVASELAASLLELAPGSRALAMTVAPAIYIATILGGPNSRVELRMAAPGRLARLARRLDAPLAPAEGLSEGELAAMSWACEMTALAAAEAGAPGRTLWLDFDGFLAAPAVGLGRALHHLHGEADPVLVEQLAGSAYFQRYSKAPEYAYGADVRREVLAAARRDEAAEIARGLAWLARAATHPAVAAALARAEAAHGA